MRVLVTGNLGYIGSVLTELLSQQGYDVVGLDTDYYGECGLEPLDHCLQQITKDIRDVGHADVEGFDAVIHLAALSNDPLGDLAPGLTEEINFDSTLRFAELAKSVGVERFVFASTQSMYGVSHSAEELDEDESEKQPVTAYAKTKWIAETQLRSMADQDFTVVCFRPSTVFGVSPRLRCDIVFNNLVACAYTTGRVEVKSDGTAWRPIVHVKDVSQAFIAGLEASPEELAGQAFNVGLRNGNFTVREMAEAAQRAVPGCDLVFTNDHIDPRTYRVNFERILSDLAAYYKPEWGLDQGGRELVEFFDRVGFTETDFRGPRCTRLGQINALLASGRLDDDLRWR